MCVHVNFITGICYYETCFYSALDIFTRGEPFNTVRKLDSIVRRQGQRRFQVND